MLSFKVQWGWLQWHTEGFIFFLHLGKSSVVGLWRGLKLWYSTSLINWSILGLLWFFLCVCLNTAFYTCNEMARRRSGWQSWWLLSPYCVLPQAEDTAISLSENSLLGVCAAGCRACDQSISHRNHFGDDRFAAEDKGRKTTWLCS